MCLTNDVAISGLVLPLELRTFNRRCVCRGHTYIGMNEEEPMVPKALSALAIGIKMHFPLTVSQSTLTQGAFRSLGQSLTPMLLVGMSIL